MSASFRPILLAAALAAAAATTVPAQADRGGWRGERTGFDEPLRFRGADGGAFRPRAVVVTGAAGTVAARLPEAANLQSEDRVDLSGLPLLGPLFPETLDVASARQGALVGPVYRAGDTLVVDAGTAPTDLTARRVALATNLPRLGAVSYELGLLPWGTAAAPAIAGAPIGTAHIVGGRLVLASQGGEPGWPSVEALFRGR